MGIDIGADIINNLDIAQNYKWLERNKAGAYSSSTIVGMNTQRSQGLLVVPFGETGNLISVLSKMEESVFIENSLHDISVNRYSNTIFPHGNKYLQKFEQNPFPRFIYQIEARIIHKTLFLLEEQNLLVLRYELKNQEKPVKIIIKPFITVRPNQGLSNDVKIVNTDSYLGQGWVRWAPRANLPELYVFFNRGEFVPATLWYHNFYYQDDEEKFTELTEDLFNPGFFRVELKPYDAIDLFISTDKLDLNSLNYESIYRKEAARRFHPQNLQKSDRLSLDLRLNFSKLTAGKDQKIIPVSSLESENSLRDQLLILPSLLISKMGQKQFINILVDLVKSLNNGLLPIHYPAANPNYGAADLSLWIFELAFQYLVKTDDLQPIETHLYDSLRTIYNAYLKGTSGNIYVDKDSLVYSGNSSTSTSWIPLTDINGEVLRYGKLLEVNALWYNAVRILEEFSMRLNKKRLAGKFKKMAGKIAENFSKTLFNTEKDTFFDFVNLKTKNNDFRINQIVPLSLSFCVIEKAESIKLLKEIEEKLVTPYGLKSQDKNIEQNGKFISKNKPAYYCGAVWPWTIYLYIRACLNLQSNDEYIRSDLLKYIQPCYGLMSEGLLGYLPEIVMLNEKASQNGIADYTPSMAALVWVDEILKEIEK